VVVHDQTGDLGFSVRLFRHCQRIVFGSSDRKGELLRLPLRLEPSRAPVGDAEFAGERRDLAPNRLRFLGAEIRAPSVELPGVREELRPVRGKMLARSGAQEEEIRPDAGRAGLARRLHDFAELSGD
jgi:hypothetical protein